jgi:cell division septum initiation protein DivIVA
LKEVVINLAMEVVKRIIDTEKEGEEIIKKAQVLAAEIQKKSKDEAEAVLQETREKAEDYYKSTISKYEMEGKEASKPMLEENQQARAKLTNIPAELMNRAVNMIIERIVDSHGDS